MDNSKKTMEKVVALCKGRGYVYPGSEIYGGLSNTWDSFRKAHTMLALMLQF